MDSRRSARKPIKRRPQDGNDGRRLLSARGESTLKDPGTLTDRGVRQAIDFDGEVNLFHFFLLRSVGKGAFGKVRPFSPSISQN